MVRASAANAALSHLINAPPTHHVPMSAGTIDMLAYTDKENEVPLDWEESDPRYIHNAADVKLRAFSTKVSWGWWLPHSWRV